MRLWCTACAALHMPLFGAAALQARGRLGLGLLNLNLHEGMIQQGYQLGYRQGRIASSAVQPGRPFPCTCAVHGVGNKGVSAVQVKALFDEMTSANLR